MGLIQLGMHGSALEIEAEDIGQAGTLQIGGKSILSQEEAYTTLKSVPLSRAKLYVARLARTYMGLRRDLKSFERFESRGLRRYSKGTLEFNLRWNVQVVAAPAGYVPLKFQSE
ncbi:hypothetical protein [Nitratifractor sp.]